MLNNMQYGPDEKASSVFKRAIGASAAALRFTWTLSNPDGVSKREECKCMW